MDIIRMTLPLNKKKIERIQAGDNILLTGYIYTARDAAHKRMLDLLSSGGELPFDIKDQTIYYTGPAPAKPGYIVGPAGPTTSCRMDSYTIPLLEKGLNGMIGKGTRSNEVIEAIIKYKAVYFAAVGGAAALLSKTIKSVEIICYEDLGTEAVQKMYVEDFPVISVIDSRGNNLYIR